MYWKAGRLCCKILHSGDHSSSGMCSDELTGRIYQAGNHGLVLLPRPLPSIHLGYLSAGHPLHRMDILNPHWEFSRFLYLPPLSCIIASTKRFHNHTLLPLFIFHMLLFGIPASSIFKSLLVLVILWSSCEWEKMPDWERGGAITCW